MAREVFKFEGGRELEAALLDLPTATSKRIGRFALRKAGAPILAAYKAKTKNKSGDLVESEVMGTRLNKRQKRLNGKPSPREVQIHIGTNDPAGIQEEFGGRQEPNPALRPAWDAHGGTKALNTISREMWAAIGRAAKRARKA